MNCARRLPNGRLHAERATTRTTEGGGDQSMDIEPLERAIEPIASSLKGA